MGRESPPRNPLGPYGPAYGAQVGVPASNQPVDLSSDPDLQKTARDVGDAVRDGRRVVHDLVNATGEGLQRLHEGALALEKVPRRLQEVQNSVRDTVQGFGEDVNSARRTVSAASQFASDAQKFLTGAGRLLDSFKPSADPGSAPQQSSLVAETAPRPPSRKPEGMAP